MLKLKRLERFTGRPLRLAVFGAAGVLLVAAVLSFHHSLFSAHSAEARSNTPASSFAVKNDPKPLPKVNGESTASTGGNAASGSPASTQNKPGAQSVVPGVNEEGSASDCADDMARAQDNYNGDVQKEKKKLDDILSFRVGLNISSRYVSDYNNNVTSIFNEYLESANKENCTWPVKQPAVLPIDYSL